MKQEELASFVESQLESEERTRVLVQGMYIHDDIVWKRLPFAPAIGTRVWVDLRGRVTPRLTADRKGIVSEDVVGGAWQAELSSILDRIASTILGHFLPHGSCYFELLNGITFKKPLLPKEALHVAVGSLSVARFNQSLEVDRRRNHVAQEKETHFSRLNEWRSVKRDLDGGMARDIDLRGDIELVISLARGFDRGLGESLDHVLESALKKGSASVSSMLGLKEGRRSELVDHLRLLRHCQYYITNVSWCGENMRYDESWPLFRRNRIRGRVGSACCVSPTLALFDFAANGRRIAFADRAGLKPEPLTERGYDLCLPLSAVPLGELRRKCDGWRIDRRVSALGVAPFLMPEFQSVWRMHVALLLGVFGVPRIFAFLPCLELYEKHFDQWSADDWCGRGYSVVWEVDSGRVLWAEGAHHVDEMPRIGQSTDDFFR